LIAKRWVWAGKLILGIALVAALLLAVGDLSALGSALSKVTWKWVVILIGIAVLMIMLSAMKWQLFLRRAGAEKGVWQLCRLYLVGYFVNLVMPSYVGGDVVRSFYAAGPGGRNNALSATFLERYTGLVMMVVMALASILVGANVTSQIRWMVVGVAVILFTGSLVAFLVPIRRWAHDRSVIGRVATKAERFQEACRFGLSDPKLVGSAGLLSLVFHLFTVVNTLAVAWSIGWQTTDFWGLCAVVPLILLIGAIPISPQGLGIQEGAFFFFLQGVGASGEQALAVALVLRAKGYFLALCGAGVFLFEKPDRSVSGTEA
jgi:glycosyltransferase 2 family protein